MIAVDAQAGPAADWREPNGAEIRERRRSLDWTQAELARRSDVSLPTIESLERPGRVSRGRPGVRVPTRARVAVQLKVAAALQADLEQLFHRPAAGLDTRLAADRAGVSGVTLMKDWHAGRLSALNCEPRKPQAGRAVFAALWDPAELDRYRRDREAARAGLWEEGICSCGCGESFRRRRRKDRTPERSYRKGHYHQATDRHGVRAELESQAGRCGSPTCRDPECSVKSKRCHRPGCRKLAHVAKCNRRDSRYVKGKPTRFCSTSCAMKARNVGLGSPVRVRELEAEGLTEDIKSARKRVRRAKSVLLRLAHALKLGEQVNGPGSPMRLSPEEVELLRSVCEPYDAQSWEADDGLTYDEISRRYRRSFDRPMPAGVRGRYAPKAAARKGTVVGRPRNWEPTPDQEVFIARRPNASAGTLANALNAKWALTLKPDDVRNQRNRMAVAA